MSTSLAAVMLAGLSVGMVGCTEETGVTSKTEIQGPKGKTTITDKTTIDKSGQNPPAVVPIETKTP